MSYQLICKVCTGDFKSQVPHAVYCSDTCRSRAEADYMLAKYYENHDVNKKAQVEKRRQRILRRWDIILQKFGNQCSKCHHTFPIVVYDLHHPHGKKSRNDTPAIVIANACESKFLQMLEVTVLMCANCHRLHHAETGNWAPARKKELNVLQTDH